MLIRVIRKVKFGLDRVLAVLVMLSMAVLVLDVVWQVVTRFILRDPSSWTEELATFLMIWVGLLGGSVALNRGAHLGIDYFTGKLSARKRLYTDIIVFLCVGLFSFFVMFIGGIQLVGRMLQYGQVSPALNWKMGYVYLALPISGFFLVIYCVEILIERFVSLRQNDDPSLDSQVGGERYE